MILYVGDKLVSLSNDDLERMHIGEGKEGIVYRYGDKALKIYKDDQEKCRLDEEDSIKLSEIKTERVLLPRQMIYEEDYVTFAGYSTPYINKSPVEEIADMDIMQFVDELDMINNDFKVLADNGVLVDDLDVINLLYNGKLFIGDPGSYIFTETLPGKIYRSNVYSLNQFVTDEVFQIIPLPEEDKMVAKSRFNKYEYIGEQIRNSASLNETVREYVKKMAS